MSLSDQQYIKEHVHLGPEVIAAKLNRTPEAIASYITDILGISLAETKEAKEADEEKLSHKRSLRDSPEWTALEAQFTAEELRYFAHRYSKYMAQFDKDGLVATEETQVMLLVQYELLMNRNLKASKEILQTINRMQKVVQGIYDKYTDESKMTDTDRRDVSVLENQLLTLRTAQQAKSSEFVNLQGKHSAILKELKATRDQRITRLENSKQTLLGLLRAMQESAFRDKEGEAMEISRLGGEEAYARLGEYHVYDDGQADKPILSVDTLEDEDE